MSHFDRVRSRTYRASMPMADGDGDGCGCDYGCDYAGGNGSGVAKSGLNAGHCYASSIENDRRSQCETRPTDRPPATHTHTTHARPRASTAPAQMATAATSHRHDLFARALHNHKLSFTPVSQATTLSISYFNHSRTPPPQPPSRSFLFLLFLHLRLNK